MKNDLITNIKYLTMCWGGESDVMGKLKENRAYIDLLIH